MRELETIEADIEQLDLEIDAQVAGKRKTLRRLMEERLATMIMLEPIRHGKYPVDQIYGHGK